VLRAERETLCGLVAGLARVEAPADFEFRLRARIARTEGAAHAHSSRRTFVPGAAWLAVAGCLVLALGVFVHFRQPQDHKQEIAAGAGSTATIAERNAPTVEEATTTDRNKQSSAHNDQPVVNETVATASVNRVRMTSRTNRAPRSVRFVLPQEAVEEIANTQPAATQPESRTSESKGSPIYIHAPIALPVTTQGRRLEAMFKDMRGAERVVAVDPVTFGARERTPQRASMKTVSTTGVW
jgi:hypothetical protein